MVIQFFLSHTRRDENFCDRFEPITTRLGEIKVYRSEFEDVGVPSWKTIKEGC